MEILLKNKNGKEKIKYHKATTKEVALIFSEFSFEIPNKGNM